MNRIDRDAFKASHELGLDRYQLAEHFGIAAGTVTRIRRELGLPLDERRRRTTPTVRIDRDRVKALVEDGWTSEAIARQLKCHPDSISRIRAELGIAHDYLGRPMTEERKQNIAAMIEDGWSHAEIHRTEGADPETLSRYFPGTAWTPQQRSAHISALRIVNIHFNRRPASHRTQRAA